MANGAENGGLVITVEDDPAGDVLNELREWLREDIRGLRITAVRAPIPQGHMSGGALAALETAVLSKELLGMVVTGVAGWLTARATNRRVTVRLKHGEKEVEFSSSDVRGAEDAARRLYRDLGGE